MARKPRNEVFCPDEVAIVHVMNRVVRRCFLLGDDPVTGVNYDHRKEWIEELFQRCAASFGIDLICFSILSNHFHLILRSRPDVVATWSDTEVAQRWLTLCPIRKLPDGSPAEPNEFELNFIRNNPEKATEIRSRLSDISWWMRLLCQRIATQANTEDDQSGRFWQDRFTAVRILDELSLLACAAYVELNPIRAALAETLEESDFTSVQRRIQSRNNGESPVSSDSPNDRFLAPLFLNELGTPGPRVSASPYRCSDKGCLAMPFETYLELLDWTARRIVPGKRGFTPENTPPIFERLAIDETTWCELVGNFRRLFYYVAGEPATIDNHRSQETGNRFHMRTAARALLTASA